VGTERFEVQALGLTPEGGLSGRHTLTEDLCLEVRSDPTPGPREAALDRGVPASAASVRTK